MKKFFIKMIVKLEQKEFLLQLWHFWILQKIPDFLIQSIWKKNIRNFLRVFHSKILSVFPQNVIVQQKIQLLLLCWTCSNNKNSTVGIYRWRRKGICNLFWCKIIPWKVGNILRTLHNFNIIVQKYQKYLVLTYWNHQ
jgi:hypothetical protein